MSDFDAFYMVGNLEPGATTFMLNIFTKSNSKPIRNVVEAAAFGGVRILTFKTCDKWEIII